MRPAGRPGLDGLAWAADAGRALGSAHQIGAATAFLAGVRHGHRAAGGAGDPVGGGDDEWDERLDPPLAAVDAAAGAAAAVLPRVAERQAHRLAAELAVVWAALGRFAGRRLGVPPEALLAARGLRPLADEVVVALGRYRPGPAEPAGVAGYLGMLDLCWAERFGPEDEDDE